MSNWYVFDAGVEEGPLGDDEVLAYLKDRDTSRVHVWRSDLPDWKLARDVPEIHNRLRASMRPLVAMREPLVAGPWLVEQARPIKKRKLAWAAIAGLITLAGESATLLLDGKAARLGLDRESMGYVVGYIGLGPLVGAFIGFIAGALSDRSLRRARRATDQGRAEKARFNNPIARYWRGDYPLWVSFWSISLGNLVANTVLVLVVADFKAQSGYEPLAIFSKMGAIWISALLIATWQIVGLWRSATAYTLKRARAGKKAVWAALAQAAVVVGFLGFLKSFISIGIPQLVETYGMAFRDDPDIPAYAIRVMRGGTEAEIVGGFKYGLTDDFAKILKASRQIKVVHLDSSGGRVGEGEKLSKLIRERGLTTYVSSKCLSACTLAFAAGRERYIAKNATLGFHRGAFPGINEGEPDNSQRSVFRTAGFDPKFIETALSTPHQAMWRPSADILLAAGVITGVTDGTKFALSGVGAYPTKEEAAEALTQASPTLRALQARVPKQFASLIDEAYEGILQGKTEAEMVANLRAKSVPLILSLMPLADDDVLVDYNRLLIDEYAVLGEKNASACYIYASGTDPMANFGPELPVALLAREREVQERAIRSAAQRPKVATELIWTKVHKQLSASGMTEADFSLLASTTPLEKSKHSHYCALAIMFLREIGRLPQRDAALLMREVLSSK